MDSPANEQAVYRTKVRIHFREADPAGILFFGHVLGLSHDVFEEFLMEHGIPWEEWFKAEDWACPIRHSEVDYRAPFMPGQSYQVEVRVQKIGQSSLTMHYIYLNQNGQICAHVHLVHTFVSRPSFQKMDVPEKYRKIFSRYQ
jgi:acyl-CoA thioester hydrolase/1,4-dihydroxy-2-naphthoyl-CoA hydrolase